MKRLAALAVCALLLLTGCSVKTDADRAREACVVSIDKTDTHAEALDLCEGLSDERVVDLWENGWFKE